MNVTVLAGKAWGKHHTTLFFYFTCKWFFFFFLALLLSLSFSSLQVLINQTLVLMRFFKNLHWVFVLVVLTKKISAKELW